MHDRLQIGNPPAVAGCRVPEVIHERIGMLKQASFGVAQHHTVTPETNPEATADNWHQHL
jgi:hypothetical protein